jgi:hypothetical protein
VLTARALARQPGVRSRDITVVAFDPGQVFGTGLARDLAPPLRIAWSVLGTPIGAPLRWRDRNLNTRAAASRALAALALGTVSAENGSYAALRRGRITWADPSALAQRDDVAQALWADSARLVGLDSRPA